MYGFMVRPAILYSCTVDAPGEPDGRGHIGLRSVNEIRILIMFYLRVPLHVWLTIGHTYLLHCLSLLQSLRIMVAYW